MKRDFDNTQFRLTDAEKDELWRRVAPATRPRGLIRPRLIPALATGAVAVATLAVVVYTRVPHPARDIGPTPTTAPAAENRLSLPASMERRLASNEQPPTAAPAAPPRSVTVAPPAETRREPAVAVTPPVDAPVREASPGAAADGAGRSLAAGPEPRESAGERLPVEVRNAVKEQNITSERLTKYAIDSAEDTGGKKSGVDRSSADLYVRGGRSGPASMRIDDVPMDQQPSKGAGEVRARAEEIPAYDRRGARHHDDEAERAFRARCWVPPQDREFDMMEFRHSGTNPFVLTEADPLSTFALDVDNASYTVTRAYLERDALPPAAAVRVEEFVNFFDQDYRAPSEGDFRITVDGAPSPFGEGYHLLRVGLRARDVSAAARKPASLVFVIDVSGSMKRENRLELVKRALHVLLNELDASDTVGIVTYTTHASVVLEPTTVANRALIEDVIARLYPQNSTNVNEGLEFGYRMARAAFRPGAINRIILCSDGVANEAITVAEGILDDVRREADAGIHLTAVGFGMGNYNDVLLEKLADRGDGNYYYVDDLDEARRVFRENLTGTLQTVAKDAKVQVEFDPEAVLRWRLLGYENRDVADEDFRNDAVDAGEVGAGHQVTALYEVKLAPAAERELSVRGDRSGGRRELGTVRLRYRQPESEGRQAGLAREEARRITLRDLAPAFGRAAPRLRLDAAVAEFAEILRRSYWARDGRLDEVARLAAQVAVELPGDRDVREFAELVHRAAALDRHGRLEDDDEERR